MHALLILLCEGGHARIPGVVVCRPAPNRSALFFLRLASAGRFTSVEVIVRPRFRVLSTFEYGLMARQAWRIRRAEDKRQAGHELLRRLSGFLDRRISSRDS